MGVNSRCEGVLILGSLLSLLLVGSFCQADDKINVEVVGTGECSDCEEYNIKTSHAFKGLRVTIDCKLKDGHFKTKGVGELDEQGNFKVSLPKDSLKDEEECYAQLHSAFSAPCPAHNGLEATKIVAKSGYPGTERTFEPTEKLKFSTALCTSAFLWPHFKHPPLTKPYYKHPLLKKPYYKHPPLTKPYYKHPLLTKPYYKHPLLTKPYYKHPYLPSPHYKHPSLPKWPPYPQIDHLWKHHFGHHFKYPPIYKKPYPPIYKPQPPAEPKPLPPPAPEKPKPPAPKKPKPPVVKPPVPIKKPIIPKIPKIPKIPPKNFHHHHPYHFPPLPPHYPHA